MTIIFGGLCPFYVLAHKIKHGGQLSDAFRGLNRLFGQYVVGVSWPFIRTHVTKRYDEVCPTPCLMIVNHRSFADIFFCSLIPVVNGTVFIRSWPFKIWILGTFMRWAGYVDIESKNWNEIFEIARQAHQNGISILVFPEGHRSRDGKLRRFQSGAFRLAAAFNMPILPVIMTGTEKLTLRKVPVIRTTEVHIEIMPPVYPENESEPHRERRLKKKIEQLYRERLNE